MRSVDEILALTANDVDCLFAGGIVTVLGVAVHIVGTVAPTTVPGKFQWHQRL